MPTKVALIVQSIVFGVICVLWIAETVELNLYNWGSNYVYKSGAQYKAYLGLLGTYTTIYFLAVIATSALLIVALVRLSHNPVLSQVRQGGCHLMQVF